MPRFGLEKMSGLRISRAEEVASALRKVSFFFSRVSGESDSTEEEGRTSFGLRTCRDHVRPLLAARAPSWRVGKGPFRVEGRPLEFGRGISPSEDSLRTGRTRSDEAPRGRPLKRP